MADWLWAAIGSVSLGVGLALAAQDLPDHAFWGIVLMLFGYLVLYRPSR